MKLGLWTILCVAVWVLSACGGETDFSTERLAPTTLPNTAVPAVTPVASGTPTALPATPIQGGNAPMVTPQVRLEWTAEAIQNATAEAELRFTDTPVPDPVLTLVSQGIALREVWQQQGLSAAAPPTLLYALGSLDYREHTFWRVGLDTLTQPEQLTDEPHQGRHLSGSVSSDGRWVA